jgi:hypothetical protein
MLKKLGIYVFYDKDGIVDRYVFYFLAEVKKYLDQLIVVVNGKLSCKGKEKLNKYVDEIIVRENIGYDAMAVRRVLVDRYKWVNLYQYDRVVVMNDTFFGPFYSMQNIFTEIEGNTDLWGVMAQVKGEAIGVNVTRVNSFFYSMSKKLLKSENWMNFWNNLEADKWSFAEVLENYENRLVDECEKSGCTWDAYLRSDNVAYERKESSYADYWNLNYELIKYYNYPFLKKKPFSRAPDFTYSDARSLKKAMDFIDREMNYDVTMIWENILRKYSILNVKSALQLTKILSEEKTCKNADAQLSDVAIILKIEQRDWLTDYIQYIEGMKGVHIYIFTKDKLIYDSLNKSFNIIKASIQMKYCMLVRQYIEDVIEITKMHEIVLYIDDADMVYANNRIVAGRTCQNLIHECMWKSISHVEAILGEFRTQRCLGVGILPQMLHGKYMNAPGNNWESYFPVICDMVLMLKKYIVLDEQETCINTWPAFWVRSSILEKTCNALIKGEDTKSFEQITAIMGRAVPYVAQAVGFFTEEFLDVQSAEIYYSNLEYLMKSLLERQNSQGNTISEYQELRYIGMKEFCCCNEIYVYGAGFWGKRVLQKLKEMKVDDAIIGFIVTDGHKTVDRLEGYPVYELREIKPNELIRVIVAVNKDRQYEIVKSLEDYGVRNIFRI